MDYSLPVHQGVSSYQQAQFFDTSVCILPINPSTIPTTIKHSPHIVVSGKFYEPIGDWFLTGTLEAHERCGEFVRALGCTHFGENNQKHDRIIETYSCHRPGCPVCYESWAFREAERATERLREGQQVYYEAGKSFSLKHVVFSPDTSKHAEIKRMLEHGNYKS